jgi:hypothetical protein
VYSIKSNFNSSVIDVAIGLVFVFLLLSLICSAANELIEAVLKKRASDLERGIQELVGQYLREPEAAQPPDSGKQPVAAARSSAADQFVAAIYNHGLINSLYRDTYEKL